MNERERLAINDKVMMGSIIKLTGTDGTAVFEASYDAWGNQTVTNNTFEFHRGYTGHEHLPEFGLINMNGRMYDPVLGRFLSPDPFVQAPEFSQNFNRYAYCLNNPFKYTDPSGYVFGVDDALIILAMAYFGGMQANFAHAAEQGTNPFNPGNWNWGSAHTYIGIAGGAMGGAGMAGYAIPYTQVPGMLPNGALQAGIQVTLNGIGNLTDDRKFFDNWYWSAGMGFASGVISGYGLAKEKGLNYWWGNSVKHGRTQWSFFTSELPITYTSPVKDNFGNVNGECALRSFEEFSRSYGMDEYNFEYWYQQNGNKLGVNPNEVKKVIEGTNIFHSERIIPDAQSIADAFSQDKRVMMGFTTKSGGAHAVYPNKVKIYPSSGRYKIYFSETSPVRLAPYSSTNLIKDLPGAGFWTFFK
jgi:RHS repeat-associated protein